MKLDHDGAPAAEGNAAKKGGLKDVLEARHALCRALESAACMPGEAIRASFLGSTNGLPMLLSRKDAKKGLTRASFYKCRP